MKTRKTGSLLVVWVLFFLPNLVSAQNEEDIIRFLSAGQEDGSKLIGAYVEPVVKSMSYGMTGGWYTTAKAHKSFGVDVSVSLSFGFIPDVDDYFDPSKLGLTTLTGFANTTKPGGLAPTFFGPKEKTTYSFSGDLNGVPGVESTTIPGPEGLDVKKQIGFAAFPVPMVQIGIGIIKNTDLKVRFVPKQEIGGVTGSMIGFGVMHDIKQHIPGIRDLPFDLSVLLAYNSVTGDSDLKHTSSGPSDPVPGSPDGKMNYKFNSYVGQALISKKIAVLTFYAGVGYSAVDTDYNVKGNFTMQATPAAFTIKDPVNIAFDNNSMRLTGGMRLNLGPIYFCGDYTLQKYNTFTFGFGVSVR